MNRYLTQKIQNDIDIVYQAVKLQGFNDKDATEFINKLNIMECLEILEGFPRIYSTLGRKKTTVLMLRLASCAMRDKNRICYWLWRRQVTKKDQLDETAEVFKLKFEDRCPKIFNSAIKREAVAAQIRDAKS